MRTKTAQAISAQAISAQAISAQAISAQGINREDSIDGRYPKLRYFPFAADGKTQ